MGPMRTTIDLQDKLLMRAKRHVRQTGRPLRAVVEQSLRRVLSAPRFAKNHVMPDLRTGDPNAENTFDAYSWRELWTSVYNEPGAD